MSNNLGSAAMPITVDACEETSTAITNEIVFSSARTMSGDVKRDKIYNIQYEIMKKCERLKDKKKNKNNVNINEVQSVKNKVKTTNNINDPLLTCETNTFNNKSNKKTKDIKKNGIYPVLSKSFHSEIPNKVVFNNYPQCNLFETKTFTNLVCPNNSVLMLKIDNDKHIEMSKKIDNENKTCLYFDELSSKTLDTSNKILAHVDLTGESEPKVMNKDRSDKSEHLNIFKCLKCSFLTIYELNLKIHYESMHKSNKVILTPKLLQCIGCRNEFSTNTSLKIHLLHDHQVAMNEVKTIMKSFDGVFSSDVSKHRSCLYDETNSSGEQHDMLDDLQQELPSDYEDQTYNTLSSCISNQKQSTMLESYLDDLNEKHGCHLQPPSLSQNGTDILENTFNFTAPVSEQLPEIQPQPETPKSNLIEETHSQSNSHHSNNSNQGYLSLASVYPQNHQHANFKTSLQHHFDTARSNNGANQTFNTMLQDPYNSQLDIPVIDIDENSMLKATDKSNTEDASLLSVLDDKTNTKSDVLDIFKNDFYNSMYVNGDEIDVSGSTDNTTSGISGGKTVYRTYKGVNLEKATEEKRNLKRLGFGFRCDINGCKVRLQSEENIRYHRRCHEGTLYNCPECYKDCPTWISLSSHLWQAHKIDMDLYTCDQCSYKTPSYSRLTNIHRGIHGTVRPFLCEVCGRRFKTVKQMRNHKNTHKAKMVRIPVFHCGICGRNVSDKRQLQLHINNVHKKKKPFACPSCDYKASVKASLTVHMRRHTGDKPYSCDKCEYKSADPNSLRRHKMKHSGIKNYKCNYCEYSSIQSSTFKVHMKTKHPGRSTDSIFSCSQCSFQTLKSGMLMTHMIEHDRTNTCVRKNSRYYTFSQDIDVQEHEVITDTSSIVDLSLAHDLLEDDYYERITGDLEEPLETNELKLKNVGVT